MTPLYVTCDKGHDKIVQLLLDHGAQVDIADEVSDICCIDVQWSRNKGFKGCSCTPNNFNVGAAHPYLMQTPCYVKNCHCVCVSR